MSKPNLPVLARGQKYAVECPVCQSKALIRGTTRIIEAEDLETWGGSDQITEYECQRQTCKSISYLTVRIAKDGMTLHFKAVKNDGVRTVLS